MKKSFLLHFDNVGGIFNNTKISHLRFDIMPESLTIIRSQHKDAVFSLIVGKTLPHSGSISLSGVNITERNANERRVAVMPFSVDTHDIKKLLCNSVNDGVKLPTAFELKISEKKAEIAILRKSSKSEDADKKKAAIKQAEIDITAIGLKMKRRRDELEINLKTAKSLLSSISKSPLEQRDDYIDKLRAKVFSAQYELSMFSHKFIPNDAVNNRIKSVCDTLGLSASSSDIELAFAYAFVKAPVLIVLLGEPDDSTLKKINQLIQKTGVSVAIIADTDYTTDIGSSISIDETCFSHIG